MSRLDFSFRRFAGLLAVTLEVASIIALVIRSAVFLWWLRSGGSDVARRILDDTTFFLVLAVLLLLLVSIWRIVADGRPAVFPTIRAVVYLLICAIHPYPLGGEHTAKTPNHAMERTADRLYARLLR